jgi:hypothetical protein
MLDSHYASLYGCYGAALVGWFVAYRLTGALWPAAPEPEIKKPWLELGWAFLGAVGVILVGQLWTAGIKLPEGGQFGPIFAAVNQVAIFFPILAVPALRRMPWSTAWLSKDRLVPRLAAGWTLAILAIVVYSLLRSSADTPWAIAGRIFAYENVDELIQVLLEDIAIAIVFVRASAALSRKWALTLVAVLFAAGHIPAMMSGGALATEFVSLVFNAGLGLAVISVLSYSRDILWFWPVHFVLDMTQFDRITFGG